MININGGKHLLLFICFNSQAKQHLAPLFSHCFNNPVCLPVGKRLDAFLYRYLPCHSWVAFLQLWAFLCVQALASDDCTTAPDDLSPGPLAASAQAVWDKGDCSSCGFVHCPLLNVFYMRPYHGQ